MIVLAHVEAPCPGDEFGIAIVRLPLGINRAAAIARLLERHTVLAAFGHIKKGPPVWSEQPFVGGEDEKVGIEATHVDLHHAHGVRGIDQKHRSLSAQPAATRSISTTPPSAQCTDEMEARATGAAPGFSIAARTAAVQSPSCGRGTASMVNRPAQARVAHSNTADEWSFSSTRTREDAGTVMSLAAVATPLLTDEISATSSV